MVHHPCFIIISPPNAILCSYVASRSLGVCKGVCESMFVPPSLQRGRKKKSKRPLAWPVTGKHGWVGVLALTKIPLGGNLGQTAK